jgi:hypothetical protein
MKRASSMGRAIAVVCAAGAIAGCAALLGIDGDYGNAEDFDGGSAVTAGSTTSATSSGTGEGSATGSGGADVGSGGNGGAAGSGGTPNASGSGGGPAGSSTGAAGNVDAGRAGSGGVAGSAGAANGGSAGSGGAAGAASGGSAGAGGVAGMGGKGGAAGGPIDAGRVSPIARVQRGSTTLAAGMAAQKVTVQQLDTSRSFVVFGSRFDSAAPADIEVTAQITAPTELTFTRTGTTGTPAVPIYYYVAEFTSGVQVQRGTTTVSATTTTATLTNVNLAKSFPIVTYRNTGSNIGKDDFVRAKLTSSTQLSLINDLAAPNGVAEWQVVTFEGATVQSGDVTIGDTANMLTATVQPVDPAKTWLLLSYDLGSFTSGVAQEMIRGKVDSTTQLAFRRSATGAAGTLTWYAISFNNGTTVQSATTNVGDTATSATAALSSVDTLKTIATAGGLYNRAGSTPIVTNESPGQATFTLELTSGTQLSLTRGAAAAGSAPSVDWFAVNFN